MHSLKLIFMGTPDFALPTLKCLMEAGHEIAAVYTQPPRPAGRGHKMRLSAVHAYAASEGLNVLTPLTLKAAETQAHFRAYDADAAIVAAYGLLLPQAILGGTKLGCINVHPSLLPRWRGAAPIQRTVMAGDSETGIVIMQMDAGLDTGDMLLLRQFPVKDDADAGALHDLLAGEAGPMVVETLNGLVLKTIVPKKQSETGINYAKKINKEECRIDWRESARTIYNKIRGLSPTPGAYFFHKDEAIKILKAEIAAAMSAEPGTVTDNPLGIACRDGTLRPLLLQRPGKKPAPAEEWLRGYALASGTVLE